MEATVLHASEYLLADEYPLERMRKSETKERSENETAKIRDSNCVACK